MDLIKRYSFLILFVFLIGCDESQEPEPQFQEKKEFSPEELTFIKSNQYITQELFDYFETQNETQFTISPLVFMHGLGIISNAVSIEDRQLLISRAKLDQLSEGEGHKTAHELTNYLFKKDSAVRFQLQSGLFYDKLHTLNPVFESITRAYYELEVLDMNFFSKNINNKMPGWCLTKGSTPHQITGGDKAHLWSNIHCLMYEEAKLCKRFENEYLELQAYVMGDDGQHVLTLFKQKNDEAPVSIKDVVQQTAEADTVAYRTALPDLNISFQHNLTNICDYLGVNCFSKESNLPYLFHEKSKNGVVNSFLQMGKLEIAGDPGITASFKQHQFILTEQSSGTILFMGRL